MAKKAELRMPRRSLTDERLRDIADTWFPEGQIDGSTQRDAIYDLLPTGTAVSGSQFGLIWPEKLDSVDLLRKAAAGALYPEKGKSLNWESARHALCIGENLE